MLGYVPPTRIGGPGLPEWNATANGYLHSAVHVWVGGSMGVSSSPNDPAFFLHVC